MPRKTRAFVLGHPVGHSRSPLLHGFWLNQLGIKGQYDLQDVKPDDLGAFFAGFKEAGFIGGNVTVPHKTAVIPFLDRIDENAQKMGAVNTIWLENGALVGGNTDGIGFIGNLDEMAPGWAIDARKAVLIGAGGAARAAVHGLLGRGLSVAICNRTRGKAQALADHFGANVTAHGLDVLPDQMADAGLLVNTTSLGMVGQPPLEIDLTHLKPTATVYDVVYVPLETALIRQARDLGHPVVGGLGMLLHQGVPGFSHWFGATPKVSPELRELIADDIIAKTAGA